MIFHCYSTYLPWFCRHYSENKRNIFFNKKKQFLSDFKEIDAKIDAAKTEMLAKFQTFMEIKRKETNADISLSQNGMYEMWESLKPEEYRDMFCSCENVCDLCFFLCQCASARGPPQCTFCKGKFGTNAR